MAVIKMILLFSFIYTTPRLKYHDYTISFCLLKEEVLIQ